MDIIVGKTAGFCYGVRRAVYGAEKLTTEKDKEICCFGEIVHNNEVINILKEKGIKFIDDLKNASGTTIIRAHGITKNDYEYLKGNQIEYVDYTCPNVLHIHKIAEEYSKKGYYIFLIGDKKHPENIGTISFCGKNSFVIEKEEDIDSGMQLLKKSGLKKLLIIAQTTFSIKEFNNIINTAKKKCDTSNLLEIKNTICNATEMRQEETEKMAKNVDVMIIIGGKNSSNTKKLYDIALKNCKKAILIENEKELNLNNISKSNVIGIMAGASTPQSSIEKVKKCICEFETK